DLIGDRHGAGLARTVEEDRPSRPRRFAEDWPTVHFHLGHKEARHGGADDGNVEIAEMIRYHEATGRWLPFHVPFDPQAPENPAGRLLQPQRALFKRHGTTHALEPVMQNAECQCKHQRHSAPEPPQHHEVNGARKRWRAAADSNLRSRSVRKSMVRNSRSQAGGAAIRAPMAR